MWPAAATRAGRARGRPRVGARDVGVALAVALIAAPAFAAPPPLEDLAPTRAFRSFDRRTSRGLPQSTPMALAQDEQGVLWIATLDGVATFDGTAIEPVPPVAGAPRSGTFSALAPRRGGGVYAGGALAVHVYDGERWNVLAARHPVASLAEDSAGALWVVDQQGGVWRWAAAGAGLEPVTTALAEPAVAVSAAEAGVFVAGRTTVARLGGTGDSVVAAGARLPDGISALLAARDGTCWVGTTSGRLYFAAPGAAAWSTVDASPLAGRRIRALAQDLRGRIWAGSESGLVAYGSASGAWTSWGRESGLKGAPVLAILADREGTIWFGFNGAGLQQWVGEAWTHRQAWDGPTPTRVTVFGVTGTADGFLAALFGRGLWKWDGRRMLAYGAEAGLTEDVRYAVEPERGTIWAATRLGIFESRAGGRFRKVLDIPSGFVTGLFRSPAGVWHATTSNHGIFRLGPEGWRAAQELNAPLPDLQVRQLLWTAAGELWVATMRGVVVFRDGAPWVLAPDRASGLPLASNCLLEPRPGEVWVGGYGGIAIHDGGRWRVMTAADGLPGSTIYSLARAADGSIWAGGSDGVGRFADGRWTVYDSRNGLLEDECNLHGLWIAPDGSVLLGGMGSLAHFDPSVAAVPTAPLRVFWRDAPPHGADGIARLPSDRRSLRVRWRAPWLSGQAVEYRTRVARLGADWSEPAKDTELRLENLASGPWLFEVAGRVEGTRSWTEPLALRVEIAPHAWETAWGRGAIALGAALAVLALVRLRTRALAGRARALERVVEERTHQLREEKERTEEQRAEAERHREAAERASRAKSMFVASMSHELRTPLNAILGFVQLLDRDRRLVAEQREQLGLIGRSGEHLLGLINDVLSLSKIEAGQMTLDEAPLDLSAMLRDVVEILRKRAETKGLRLSLEISPSLPEIAMGDEKKLRQILINLVGNALKFTVKGGVTLRAGWSDGRGIFEVEDTGPGIADEELPSLFGAFVQADAGRRSREGTGLGLLLSRAYARLMDGDVLVVSRVGVGTLFHVEVKLPGLTDAVLERRGPRRRVLGLAAGERGRRALVVDDIRENRLLLSSMLRVVGFEVDEADSGPEGLEKWHAHRPDIILLDLRMPGMDGEATARRIRADERPGAPPVKIVAVSASVLPEERLGLRAAGFDAFLPKPIQEDKLYALLGDLLEIKWRYEGEDARPAAAAAAASVSEAVADPALRGRLLEAARMSDPQAAAALIDTLRARQPVLADELALLLRRYAFDQIEDRLQASPAHAAVPDSRASG